MREHKGRSGIYQIRNTINNKVYVGKTKCFYRRFYQYVSDFRSKNTNRINNHLLNAFKKYGFESFEFSVLEFCPIEDCSERELEWMVYLDATDREKGYNLRMDSSTGMITHQETRDKLSASLKQQWSDGKRDGHSAKLKESWDTRSRGDQSKLLTKTLTKYLYSVTYPCGKQEEMFYTELAAKGFKSVLSSFHRQQRNTVKYKDLIVERVDIENQE